MEMTTYTSYKKKEIKYIPFARWYAVFIKKEDGNVSMHHFPTPELAKEFIDNISPTTDFWWNQ